MNNSYPALSFNFKVTSSDAAMGLGVVGSAIAKSAGSTFGFDTSFLKDGIEQLDSFQGVSGLGATMNTDEIKSGGFNNISYKLPQKINYENLTLKRGMLRKSSPLTKWCYNFLSQDNFLYSVKRKTVNVFLMDETDPENILMSWSFFDCFPVSVKMDEFDAQQGKLAIQTLELSYSHFKFSQ
tara:strand:+ start:685 stop:1230 length:546 start_codon:yes stop_codon:yes gene_type:complete